MRIDITYDSVVARASRRGKCSVCGKATTRSTTFTKTVNPWNKNSDGVPKSHAEVREDVRRLAAEWAPADFDHEKCRS